MKNRHRKHQENLARLKALSHELNAMIENGSFYDLSFFNRYVYIRRIKSLYNRLLGPVTELNLQKVLAAAAVVVLGTGFGTGCDEANKKDDSNSNLLVLAALAGGGVDPIYNAVESNPFSLSKTCTNPTPAFIDIDGDGDLDLFSGEYWGNFFYYENVSGATSPGFTNPTSDPYNLVSVSGYYSAPTFIDLDGDGDIDMFSGEVYGEILYYENLQAGTSYTEPHFSNPYTGAFMLSDAGTYSKPSFVDIDGDGDIDMFSGNGDGNIMFYENFQTDGTGLTSPFFNSPLENPFGLTNIGKYSAPVFADIDGDGDHDAFVGSESGSIYYFKNTGSTTAPNFAAPVENPFGLTDVGSYSTPAVADLDGDGDLDLLVGESSGDFYYFRNLVN